MRTLHNSKLYELLEARKEFLARKPEMQSLQDKIDEALARSGSAHNRLTTISNMMYSSLKELEGKWKELLKGNQNGKD